MLHLLILEIIEVHLKDKRLCENILCTQKSQEKQGDRDDAQEIAAF